MYRRHIGLLLGFLQPVPLDYMLVSPLRSLRSWMTRLTSVRDFRSWGRGSAVDEPKREGDLGDEIHVGEHVAESEGDVEYS